MLARKKFVDHYFSEEEKIKQAELKKKIEIKKKNRAKRRARFGIISVAVLSFAVAVTILYGYATITNMKVDISNLESTRVGLENEKEYLEANLEEIKTMADIEDNAMMKLGMDYPKEDQLVYIDISEKDTKTKVEDKSLVKSIFNSIQGLF